MSMPAGQLTDLLLQRVRDPWGIATSRAFVRTMLTHAQRIVNLGRPGVLDVAAMETHAGRTVYDWPKVGLTSGSDAVDARDVARIDAVRTPEGLDLDGPIDWRTFAKADRDWVKRTAQRHRFWSRLGRDIIILSPARDTDGAVTLVYVKHCQALTSDDSLTEVRDDRLPAVLALGEALILIHRRLFAPAGTALQRLDAELLRLPVAGGAGQAGFGTGGIGDAA